MELKKIFKEISLVAKKEKIPVYAVGGFVRDFLMDIAQNKDVDFVVIGSGLDFAKKLDIAMKQAGKNPFFDYQLPHAVISLKQGAGRLIRRESDRGVLMICDPRLVEKPYGKRIWRSLPAMARSRKQDQAVDFFAAGKQTETIPCNPETVA